MPLRPRRPRSDNQKVRIPFPAHGLSWRSLTDWLPQGRTLPAASWEVRHRAVTWLLVAHAVVFAIYGFASGQAVASTLSTVAVPALGAYAASRRTLPRGLRSAIGATSSMLTSAVVVHLMNGSIEAHFHFFAMIPIIALYEDWVPFGLAVLVVLLHHGLMGTIAPKTVYDHSDAWAHPWRFAFIHAAFFTSACLGAIINWRIHEKARDAEQTLAQQMRHQAHHDALTGYPTGPHFSSRASDCSLARRSTSCRSLSCSSTSTGSRKSTTCSGTRRRPTALAGRSADGHSGA